MANEKHHEAYVARKVTWIGMIVNIMLSVFKLVAGIIGHSQAMVADGVHSISDLTTDAAVLIGIRYWSTPADEDHPYGHERIESLVTAFVGVALFIVGIGIAYNGIVTAFEPDIKSPELIALIAAFVSIVSKELLYRWTVKLGKEIDSSSVVANAWHHRSDALSSIPALLAVGLAMIHPKLAFFDHLGAVVVAIFIIKVSIDIMKPVIMELSDKGAPKPQISQIDSIVMGVEGVKEVHSIRSRRCGSGYFVDLHVLVDGNMSVQSGHDIARTVKYQLLDKGPKVLDVMVHLEPYQTSSKKNST
ncbi:MAG TPA: cation diffusion facilitator family transporter [Spirochaetota bacterium]|nr:cation diffusion facilitator family transporter [Spirochaetota bacterium]HOT18986.1 cation diffusion facilitator family transporter [Spirochaetota bacterium]HPD04108.1 cation diffusion facilitator family transporter [Spirochaetota bacterium]HQG41583.1 cation diffusion facilitator family transporter [Spirochaetota bacterium]HRR60081.1 cation diffusion facilitator family transporter [Spirochaetota bacterium]